MNIQNSSKKPNITKLHTKTLVYKTRDGKTIAKYKVNIKNNRPDIEMVNKVNTNRNNTLNIQTGTSKCKAGSTVLDKTPSYKSAIDMCRTACCDNNSGGRGSADKTLVIKIDDELESMCLFVKKILLSKKFNNIFLFVKYKEINKTIDCLKVVNNLLCSGYRFVLSAGCWENIDANEYVSLYEIQKLEKNMFFGSLN